MAHGSPEEVAADWAAKLAGSTDKIRRGVAAVTVAPGQRAAQSKDKYQRRTAESVEKFARNSARVSLGEWQEATIEKGLGRVASGAQASQPKMAAFMGEFLPHVDRGAQQVRAMPGVTLEDGINRAAAMIRHNAGFRRGGGGG